MRPPETLPEKMFLLAFDSRRQRLSAGREFGYLLRAAALAELLRHGLLTEEAGKVRVVAAPRSSDPLSLGIWEQIEQAPSRTWRRWIRKNHHQARRVVREHLAEAGVIKLAPRRLLGLFPVVRVTLRQPHVARRLGEQVTRAVRGGELAERVDGDIAALAALAAAGQLRVALSGRDRRRHKRRLTALGAGIEPIATALRKVVTAQRAAASGG